MIITEKMIRELQRRVDVSYEEAERFLRRAGGNIDIAETYANRKDNSLLNRFFREMEKIINATLIYRIKLYKDEDVFMNLPILFFIVAAIIIGINKALFLGVIFIVIALIADCNLQITKYENKKEFRFYQTVRKNKKGKEPDIHSTEADHNASDINTIKLKNSQKSETEPDLLYQTNGVIQSEKTIQSEKMDQMDIEVQKSEVNQQDLLDEDDGYYEVTIDK